MRPPLLPYLTKTVLFFALAIILFACSEQNWPELSLLNEFDNDFFKQS